MIEMNMKEAIGSMELINLQKAEKLEVGRVRTPSTLQESNVTAFPVQAFGFHPKTTLDLSSYSLHLF